MSFSIVLSFPSGRYHATAWGKHVNEATPEWPPAPWRILRAMIAVWKRNLQFDQQVNTHFPAALAKLTTPPHYKLPPASVGHKRHYLAGYKDEDSSLVFDGFVAVLPSSQLGVCWADANLTHEEQAAIEKVLAHLNYLGRSESWCDAAICDNWQTLAGTLCVPKSANLKVGVDLIRLLCPHPDSWNLWNYGKKTPQPEPKWNLLAETSSNIHAEAWSDPPGSVWTLYERSSDALIPPPAKRYNKPQVENAPKVFEFGLDGPVLPKITETVYVAELARQALQGVYGHLFDETASLLLSGRHVSGELWNQHLHLFVLPYDKDQDGRLERIIFYAPQGFSEKEMKCFDKWRHTRGPNGLKLNMVLLSMDAPNQFCKFTTHFRSVTPFIATRHYKQRGSKRDMFPPEQLSEMNLREELVRRGLPSPICVSEIDAHTLDKVGRNVVWREFRQYRVLGDGKRGNTTGKGFDIEFAEPVMGPISLGYACHFGLGLFAAQ